jgi:hexokinase
MSTTKMTEAQTAGLNKVVDSFSVSTDRLKVIVDQFVEEMEKGLDHQGATSKLLKKLNTKHGIDMNL